MTAFNDRQFRMKLFENIIMKVEMSICRNSNILEIVVNKNRENYRIISQILGISFSMLNEIETNMMTIFQRFKLI
jgi:hypothetical protein